MEARRTKWLMLAMGIGLGLGMLLLLTLSGPAQAGHVARPPDPSGVELLSRSNASDSIAEDGGRAPLSARALADTESVLGVFTNTWSYSTLGLVYNPDGGFVRYAHESQSSSHNPTIYDVHRPSHTVLYSVALSAQNTGWPWQLDNRTGAGYDYISGTYFLPDYNGDLFYADDNIVEVDAAGNILNAWEMDDEVSSNDSADGSEIDSIIDIAVVPGSPNRYFVAAAYDDAIVYEIVLTRTGTLWTPNSWATVMTYTGAISETFQDNLGIDYDAQNGWLYHSGWYTTTILVTDLDMNSIDAFDCPGAGGYNSGVTFLEGSNPPEVWVTDFSSDQTTRCRAIGGTGPETDWDKTVAGQPWDPALEIETQTHQIVQVTDVVTSIHPFTLTERWDPAELNMVGLDIFPPVASVVTGTGSLDVIGPAGPPEVITISKWFRVEPCNWITTVLTEELEIEGEGLFDTRPVTIVKELPDLQIGNEVNDPQVVAGSVASYTLVYTNAGGYETGVMIRSDAPITAPIVHADPLFDRRAPDGRRAEWDVVGLPKGETRSIDVYVFISETLSISDVVSFKGEIHDHTGDPKDTTWIDLEVGAASLEGWEKWIDGEPWYPGIAITRETSETFTVTDVVSTTEPFLLVEGWDTAHLELVSYDAPDADVFTTSGWLEWSPSSLPHPSPMTLTKEFRVLTSTWPETILWEALGIGTDLPGTPRTRPVVVVKERPELWIDSAYDPDVYSGDEAQFVLTYGNTGGLESGAQISSTFPANARFLAYESTPSLSVISDTDGRWAQWDIGVLPKGEEGRITVTVDIAPDQPPSTTMTIWNGIFNHVDMMRDEAFIDFHVPPPVWRKYINGALWTPGSAVTVHGGATFTVTDVITTRSARRLVDHWRPEHLSLVSCIREPSIGTFHSDPAFLSWSLQDGAWETVTMTKVFEVEPHAQTYMILWEELWVEGTMWDRRAVEANQYVVLLPLVLRE